MEREFKEGDWAAYNWLDEEGNDNWKIGRIVKIDSKLFYANDDGTKRSGIMPITRGVILLSNEPKALIIDGVSNQRELLIAFLEKLENTQDETIPTNTHEEIADKFLKGNL